MSYPRLLERLFADGGAGTHLRSDILPTSFNVPGADGANGADGTTFPYVMHDDPRLTESRAPTAHASEHAPSGKDPVAAVLGVLAERAQNLGSVSGAVSIDPALGMCVNMTVSAPVTIAISTTAMRRLMGSTPQSWTLILCMSKGSSHTVAWPSSVFWPRGTAPVLTPRDIVSLFTPDAGTTWYGTVIGSAFTTV